ncbi:MAG: hypothetical protein EB116_17390 [Betaproteobacteria bacterium]|nr:hypothetical protein [Betaproteobacteria bacterium]
MMNLTEQKMRKLLGTLGFGIGLVGLAGIAGGITEAGPDFGLNEALTLLSLALVTFAMFNISMMMLQDE